MLRTPTVVHASLHRYGCFGTLERQCSRFRRRSHGPAMARGTSCFEAGGCGKGPPNDRPKTARSADLAMLFLVVFAVDAIRSLYEQGRSLWLLLSRRRDRAFCYWPCGLFNLGSYAR